MKKTKRDFYTTTEAAAIMGVSNDRILRMIKRGEMSAGKLGRMNVIYQSEIDRIRGKKQ